MSNPKEKSEEDIPEEELAAATGDMLTGMEAALGQEMKRLAKGKSKKSRSNRSGMRFAQAMMRYSQDDLAGAVEIMRQAVKQADASMPDNEPYRFYMHAVLADWVSELGGAAELEEAQRHIDIAWAFVTTNPMGQVYLAEVTERKAKVQGRMK
jgi:hypothetical protein